MVSTSRCLHVAAQSAGVRMPGVGHIRRAAFAAASLAAAIGVGACSTTATTGSAPTATPAHSCQTNPANSPVPTGEAYRPVPAVGIVSVTLSGVPSGVVKTGSAPVEVDLTVCNDSAVSYPQVGFVLVLQRCSCAPTPSGMARGTVEYYQAETDSWQEVEHPFEGTGMDFAGAFTNRQPLPKGKSVTLRYRITLDASMADGSGGVKAYVVNPDGLTLIGAADLPFTVSTTGVAQPGEQTPTATNRQSILPIKMSQPDGLAVDGAGNVYVSDQANQVWRLANGSGAQTALPFAGLQHPGNVTVDAAGNIYVTDYDSEYGRHPRVVELSAGTNTQTVIPLAGAPDNVHAVGATGNAYAIKDKEVVRFTGSNTPTVLPFTGLKNPNNLTVDGAGSVYVTDGESNDVVNRVVKLSADLTTQTEMPVRGLGYVRGLAVDAGGNVYLVDEGKRQVVKIAAGANTQTVLPFAGLNGPDAVGVDAAGSVYVLDYSGFGRVVKLAAD